MVKELSVIVPVYNEKESLPLLHQALHQALDSQEKAWEVVYVDDGSTDGSQEILLQLANQDPQHITVVLLRRNFGQTAAIAAGIDHAEGEIIVLIDADLQNDPADIPMLLGHIYQGYDVVSGWRVDRHDKMITRRLPSQIANWLISKVTRVYLHDYGCTLKAYRREVLTGFRLYGEMHRFIPIYARMVGAKIIEVPVRHHARQFGRTKYGLTRTFKVILDLFTVKFLLDYAAKPIYLFGGAGLVLFSLSFIVLSFMVFRRWAFDEHFVRSPLLQMSTMFFIMGFQAILMGLLAELLARTYHESQAKPTYKVLKVIRGKGEAVLLEKTDLETHHV
jgi:glycosyltransferase involved in cell wall biosynthesis